MTSKYEKGLLLTDVGLNHAQIKDVDEYKGYEYYLANMIRSSGRMLDGDNNTNGYVIIKPPQAGYDETEYEDRDVVRCHGGITFDRYDDDDNRIIGFDTKHSQNLYHHWDNDEIKDECKKIIDQLS